MVVPQGRGGTEAQEGRPGNRPEGRNSAPEGVSGTMPRGSLTNRNHPMAESNRRGAETRGLHQTPGVGQARKRVGNDQRGSGTPGKDEVGRPRGEVVSDVCLRCIRGPLRLPRPRGRPRLDGCRSGANRQSDTQEIRWAGSIHRPDDRARMAGSSPWRDESPASTPARPL
jgi:hypothetical protein